ncbi:hypothetical protein COLO4_10473 [Corchorus olitorius]|uniref:Protein kinase domain-containing protein n=1 Tax=Corchorus olitorius TaxID=93759 RepID=A0A1R3K8C6_9ROSI|nr:hypothetical protein COLO4_10473 [Corchorus olitorius]
MKATNNFDECQVFMRAGSFDMYKGSLKDCPIIIKKYYSFSVKNYDIANSCRHLAYKDIAIGSSMSAHRNVLKVLGCCLETELPIIVYEFGGTKFLKDKECLSPLPWKCRLKIARDLASAIAYLHTAFPRPIIHRDITPHTVILNRNNVAKLIDFGRCISIPRGESHVEDGLRVTSFYGAPEYFKGNRISEKADVYSFGRLLLELLIGETLYDFCKKHNKRWVEHKDLSSDIVDSIILTSTNIEIEQEQLLDFKTLVIRCLSTDEEQRPTMIEVGKQLSKMYQSLQSPH